jgi:hypothetical protein
LAAWRLAELGQLVDLLTAGLRTVLDDLLPVVAPIWEPWLPSRRKTRRRRVGERGNRRGVLNRPVA